MKKTFVSVVALGFIIALIFTGCNSAATTSYPTKPIEIVVPWTAGGASDLTVRALAKGLEQELGQPIMISNKEGAGGLTGATYGVQAKPDGYTLVWLGGKNSAPEIYQSNSSYTADDYIPIAQVSVGVPAIVVRSGSFASLDEFVEHAKVNQVKYAHTGRGNGPHMAGVVLAETYGLKMADVPYSSDAESLLALLRGDTDVAFMNLAAALAQEEAEEIKILALLNREKVGTAPHIPTFDETSYPIDKDILVCNGICAPIDTPDEIIKTLEAAIEKAMQHDDFTQTTEGLGVITGYMNSTEYAESMRNFIEKVSPIIQEAGLYQ